MPDLLDPNINVNVVLADAPVEPQEFGEVLYLAAPGTLGGGFTEAVRRYSTAAEVAADLLSGDITQVVADALNAGLAQKTRTGTLAVGQIPAGVAQVVTITVAGTILENEIFSVFVDGQEFTFVAPAGPDITTVADGLFDLLYAALDTAGGGDGTFGVLPAGAADIVMTNTVGTNPSQITVTTDSASGTLVAVLTTPATTPASALDALFAEDSTWYVIATELKSRGWQIDVSAWAETNKRPYLLQSSDATMLTGAATAINALVVALGYGYTSPNYHHDDAEEFAYLWPVRKLAVSPDLRSFSWAYAQLIGLTISPLTTTQQGFLDAANTGYFSRIRGVNVAWEGKLASGIYLDERVTIDWLETRMAEDLTTLVVDASARDKQIPYTDPGFATVRNTMLARLNTAIDLGHGAKITDDVTGDIISPVATVPRRSAVSAGDEAARRVPGTFALTLSGGVHRVTVNGYLTRSF